MDVHRDVNAAPTTAARGVYFRELAYDERVWGANYWGGLAADPLREREGEYLVAAVARTVDADPGLFTRFADAARAGDVEAAWLVGERATSSSRF